jgi:hypothetical protein
MDRVTYLTFSFLLLLPSEYDQWSRYAEKVDVDCCVLAITDSLLSSFNSVSAHVHLSLS